jgi:hypothetical protein
MTKMYRQGDLLLVEAESVPEAATQTERQGGALILLRGEATNHHHAILDPEAELLQVEGTADAAERYLRTTLPVQLTHQEHETIVIDPGVYQVIRQREYTPAAPRWVVD